MTGLPNGTVLTGSSGRQYQVNGELGRGGFGITYRAVSDQNQPVALKELFPSFPVGACSRQGDLRVVPPPGTEAEFDRLRVQAVSEARMLAGLQIDRVVDILDVFEANGTAYLVMELIDASPLSALVGAPWPDLDARKFIANLCETVAGVHDRGVFHGDLTPNNILVDSRGLPYLVDFGLARSHGTSASVSAGTPGYAAPELFGATSTAPGPATDVFALGVIAGQLLTGRLPTQRQPGEPITGDPVTAGAIERATALDPNQRTQNARTFLAEFQGHAAGPQPQSAYLSAPVADVVPPPPAQPASAGGRGPLLWGAVVVVLLLAAGTAWALTRDTTDDAGGTVTPTTIPPVTTVPESVDSTTIAPDESTTTVPTTTTEPATTTTPAPPISIPSQGAIDAAVLTVAELSGLDATERWEESSSFSYVPIIDPDDATVCGQEVESTGLTYKQFRNAQSGAGYADSMLATFSGANADRWYDDVTRLASACPGWRVNPETGIGADVADESLGVTMPTDASNGINNNRGDWIVFRRGGVVGIVGANLYGTNLQAPGVRTLASVLAGRVAGI